MALLVKKKVLIKKKRVYSHGQSWQRYFNHGEIRLKMLNTRTVAGQKLLLPTEFINKKKLKKP